MPARTIVRTNAFTPPRRSLRNTAEDSAPPTPWMIQAKVPMKAHAVAKVEKSGVIAAPVIGVAGSTPPSRPASDRRMKAPVSRRTSVAPIEVTEPIHLAPFVETQVAIAKMMIDSRVIHSWESCFSSP